MPIPYKTLFLLEAATDLVFEIKRLDVQSTNPGEVYFWFRFDKATQQLQPLTFVAMDSRSDEQYRTFVQGALQFGPSAGTYTPQLLGTPIHLHLIVPAILPPAAETALFGYFLAA